MNWANYLIQINLYLILFYGFYLLLLKNETFFNLNRTYLVGSAFFAIITPLLRANWVKVLFITDKVQTSWANVNVVVMQGFASPIAKDNTWVVGDYLTLAYLAIVFFLIVRLIIRLVKLSKLLKSEHILEAFSFFKKININPALPHQAQIEKHELIHAKQLHSADVIFFELLSVFNWFNPICYLYKKSIKHIHEFIADEAAVKMSESKSEYAMLLFSKNFGLNPKQLTNNFFNQSLLKRRIKMLQKPKSRKTAILKYGLSVPLFLLAIILSSAKISENKTIDKIATTVKPKQDISEIIAPKAMIDLVSKPTKNELKINKEGDFIAFKKYLAQNLKYPTEAKESKLAGKVAVEFNVKNGGKIDGVVAKTMNDNSLGQESMKAVYSYPEKLNVEAGTYTIFINYVLEGSDIKALDNTNELGIIKNYIGELVVTAFAKEKNTQINEVKVRGTAKEQDEIYQNVEVLPSFPGGLVAFGKFLGDNLKYPQKARDAKIEGRVYCQFVVEKDGSLNDIKIARGIGGGCDEEAVRVLAISPKWNPGVQNGEKVRVSYTVPIFFQMNPGSLNSVKKNLTPEQIQKNRESIDAILDRKVLMVIDGVEIDRSTKPLNDLIKPGDIESMNVLKGESAIKKYGDKGINGVIEITTKKK
ncbi:TonB family protein [Pedobacter sp. SD-b]|uniref:TonB family protein n=1 Tax=Pedobacter segetis TaxID=2793069 RepID=A0ABS1BH04_9SPHI|nr:M56 family metallopeptidase [Pedobacter segetis]MBK0382127.1 TonB family protein [Pedobacter segetis]